MKQPKSLLIPLTCSAYALVAAVGLYVAMLGWYSSPEPLQPIDESGKQSARLEEARQVVEQAQHREPGNAVLSEFYRKWLLESEYEDLSEYTEPRYEGDSLERRLVAYNRTIAAVDRIYGDAVLALALLSSGSLMLAMLMLWAPGYLMASLLASFPVAWVFFCGLSGINHDPVFSFWAPIPVLGAVIFVAQLVFAFRFGRPEHRTVEGLPYLIVYRQGLLLTNLGLFFLIAAVLMATGAISGPVRSLRASIGLALFGEGGIVAIGLLVGALLLVLGVRKMNRNPRNQGDSTSS